MSAPTARATSRPHGPSHLYARQFRDPRRERQFLASLAFAAAFAAARATTHAQRARRRWWRAIPRDAVRMVRRGRARHHHHLVWGILLLLADGYLWLLQLGTGVGRASRRGSRGTAVLYGVGAAITLDEFALWLDLEDVYWAREGRASVDAVALFGALLSAGIWGGPFLHGLARELGRMLGR